MLNNDEYNIQTYAFDRPQRSSNTILHYNIIMYAFYKYDTHLSRVRFFFVENLKREST